MAKLTVKLPEAKDKKPLLLSGNGADVCGFYTDGNYNRIKLSPAGVLKIAKNTHNDWGLKTISPI